MVRPKEVKEDIDNGGCPLLVEAGVHPSNSGYGNHKKNWIKDICLNCPYGEKCLEDMTVIERNGFLKKWKARG